jgi:hypothetical protein
MTSNRRLTLRLEPPSDREPIAGWLCDERGYERHFAGWLGLLTLLEQARLTVTGEPDLGVSQPVRPSHETRTEQGGFQCTTHRKK